jgi:hypothetical protein
MLSTALASTGDPKAGPANAKDLEAADIGRRSVAEWSSFGAVSILGYLAAYTQPADLTAGVLPIYSRTPTLTTMTPAGLEFGFGGRFVLGLGTVEPAGRRGRARCRLRQAPHPHRRACRRRQGGRRQTAESHATTAAAASRRSRHGPNDTTTTAPADATHDPRR